MKSKTNKLLLALLSLVLILSCLAIVISANATDKGNTEEGKKINVWLIAGQSNAVGYGETSNYPDGYSDADMLDAGVENVLYYGKGYGSDITEFVPVTFGLGKNAAYSGAEIGIATALSKSGEMNVVIKYADGDTQLSAMGVDANNNIATWTSPSYIKANSDISFEGDKIGDLYDGFIDTVAEAVAKLRRDGYVPTVQGFWWMQGERDGNHGKMTAELYADLLTNLISDVRRDVGIITGEDLSEMPAVYGKIYRNPAYPPNSEAGLAAVQAGQDLVVASGSVKNVAMLDMTSDLVDPETGKAKDLFQQDGWHYDSLTQQMMGEAFVKKANNLRSSKLSAVVGTPIALNTNEQALYSAKVNYVTGAKINVMLGTNELFSLSNDTLKILNATIEGTFEGGNYTVYVCVNPAQNMTMVEVTLPDGGIIRRGMYNKNSGSAIVLSAMNENRIIGKPTLSYENLTLNEYEVVTVAPEAEGFGANVYNLVTSFSDAATTRLFAWTAKADFIGTRTMAIKYRAKGTTAWTVVDAYKLTEPTEYAPEDYFKADVSGLIADTEYEYKIGVKDSTDEVNEWSRAYTFTTATGNEKEFTFIAIGDTQGETWEGTVSEENPKGQRFMYTISALNEALEEVGTPAFILHAGDVVENGLREDQWNLYFKALGEVGASVPHFAAPGNHDDELNTNDQNYYFGMHFNHPDNGGNDELDPTVVSVINSLVQGTDKDANWIKNLIKYMDETFYSYNYGDAHFVVYNSGAYSSQDELILKAQRAWLKADLEANKDAKWTVVLAHQPNYHRIATGGYARSTLADIIEGFDVDLVIHGHSHLVARSYPMKDGHIVSKDNLDVINKGEGTVYMLVGASAYNHDRFDDYVNSEEMAVIVTQEKEQSSYAVFDVTEKYIKVTVKQLDGLVLDTFTIMEKEEEKPVEDREVESVYNDDFHYFTYKDLNSLGIWETENSGNLTSPKAPSFSSLRLKLADRQSVQFNWVDFIGGVENYDPTKAYVFEIDAHITSLGDASGPAQKRALYVAFGGNYNQVGLAVQDNANAANNTQVGDGPKHQYAYTGNDTFRIRVALYGNSTYCSIIDANGTVLSGTRTQPYYTDIATDETMQTMVYRCEDGEVYLDNFSFKVCNDVEIEGYGTVPASYSDSELYPIVLFYDGEFKGAFMKNQFKAALEATRSYVGSHTGVQDHTKPAAKILLRGDAVSAARDENFGQAVGEIDINLNGFTLTQNHDGALFWLRTKTYSNEPQNLTLKVRNGNINSTSYIFAIGTQGSTTGAFKSADILFENVNLNLKRGVQLNDSLILTSNGSISNNNNTTVDYNITFNDCVFDLSRVAKNALLLNLNNTSVAVKPAVELAINGGEIKLSRGAVNTKIYALNELSTIAFGKGSNGEYVDVTVPSDVKTTSVLTNNTLYFDTAIDGSGASSGVKAEFVKTESTGYTVTYSMQEKVAKPVYIEGYGTIPADYADANTYPIVLFQNGEFKDAFLKNKFKEALDRAKNLATSGAPAAKLLLRGDAEVAERYDNIGQATSEIDINLNGYTLTQTYSKSLFYTRLKTHTEKGETFTLNIRNGNMVVNYIMFALGVQYTGSDANVKLTNANVNMTDVNVIFNAVGYNNGPIFENQNTTNNSNDKEVEYNFTMTNCTFDFSKLTKASYIFNMNLDATDSNAKIKVNLTINGGEFIFGYGTSEPNKPYNAPLYTLNSISSIKFGKGTDGEYLKLTVPSDVNAKILNNTEFAINGIEAAFVNPVTILGKTTYTLTPTVYIEGYGTIPADKANANVYPIVFFLGGEFKGAYTKSQFTEAMKAARDAVNSDASLVAKILLRGNVEATGNDQNLGFADGTIDVNLNGFTITQTDTSQLFFARTKTDSATAQSFTLNVYGGEIVIRGNLLGLGTQSNASYEQYKSGNINFTNVKLTAAYGVNRPDFLVAYSNGSLPMTMPVYYSIKFNDCIFDVSGLLKDTNVLNFNSTSETAPAAATVEVNGGEIILGGTTANSNIYTVNNVSSVTFGKGSDGNYIKVTAPSKMIPNIVNSKLALDNGVECVFVKASANDTTTTYKLMPEVMVDYKIKTSVTLYSNFVYNIYVPAANFNSASVNGETVPYTEVEIYDVTYYLIKVDLPAGETLRDIALTVTLNSGNTTVDASWTLNVFNYTKSILAGDYNDITKNLMKDMLVYASAAHTYFENTEAADKLAQIETLLGDYNRTLPEGEAKAPAEKTYFTDARVYLGEVPSFRFTLASGYTASDFTFKVGERNADAIASVDGKYVEITMYAYMMLDDVTFTVKSTGATGTYNLYSYYEYALKQNNANLVAVVEALMKYSASAKEYRDYIVYYTCSHKYVDGMCTKCGEEDPNKGTLTLNAPASIYTNYAGKDITPVFSKSWYNGEVTYTTSHPNVFVENGKIFAKGNFASAVNVTVTATTEHHTASAVVKVSTFDTYDAETKVQWYENNIIKEENKGGMIFVGDSYFDGYPSTDSNPPYWSDFYQDYAGEKAFLMGISKSQISELEIVSERLVYPMNPSEIVVHIGFNDVHHGPLTVEELVARITALLTEYHNKLPDAKIYFVGVEPKKSGYSTSSGFYESSTVKAPAVTKAMQEFAAANDWLTYVETLDIFIAEDGTINQDMYLSTDQSHPTLEAYDLIKLALDACRAANTDAQNDDSGALD